MKLRGVFITGTDTDVGKTWIATGLLIALRRRGYRVAGMKPVSCGCVATAAGPRNEDALMLHRYGSDPALPYALINPYAFLPPIAPHLAAAAEDTVIDIARIARDFQQLSQRVELVVVEGAGGWCVPLNESQTAADLARALGLPVVLVVGIRLGCLNHALLSSAAITDSGLELAGWVANLIDPDALSVRENIASLRERIASPLLGVTPHLPAFDGAAIGDRLDLDLLIKP